MEADGRTALAGRYALGELLGRGGMGEVRAGEDVRLGRAVAVKLLREDLAKQADVRRRFEVEARAAAGIAHPNVVTVYDSGEENGHSGLSGSAPSASRWPPPSPPPTSRASSTGT